MKRTEVKHTAPPVVAGRLAGRRHLSDTGLSSKEQTAMVYIACSGYGVEFAIDGVFSSLAAAEKFCIANNQGSAWPTYRVEAFRVDVETAEEAKS